MSKKLLGLVLAIAVIVLGSLFKHYLPMGYIPQASPSIMLSSASPSAVLSSGPSQCISKDGMPDPSCTPGVIAETDTYTVCHRSTKTVRPPVSYTDNLKVQQIKEYGYKDTNTKDYEEDHLISLEIGGSPTDPKNLWPEPRKTISPPGLASEDKDKIENLCHQKICSGQISLADAQREITSNWKTACQ